MKAQTIEQVEFFSEAELESLEFVPEELEAIEAERVPDLDSISFKDIAKDLEACFEAEGLENWSKVRSFRLTGRIAAAAVTRQYKPGTVGAVVHSAVMPFAKIFGDLASGNIGKHYRESHNWLKLPATPSNLQRFAQHETEWWKKQPGFAGVVGSAMSAERRAKILTCVSKNPNNPSSCSIM
jgi:hypothetical protein